MHLVKSPERQKGDCIVLDEAFLSINSRASMSYINRTMIGLATEMRQLNLFIIICLPSFFDLDRYFALWRTDLLIHTYFDKAGNRGRYILFGSNKKKELYLKGKKMYNYGLVKSQYPPCRFRKGYVLDELEYKKKKEESFRTEKPLKENRFDALWRDRLIILVDYLKKKGMSYVELSNIMRIGEDTLEKAIFRYPCPNSDTDKPTINNKLLSNVGMSVDDNYKEKEVDKNGYNSRDEAMEH
jgi:hypothetical protein